ncbi:MAG: DUF2283 domain-containing protein [SAR202 cluster bacterium]|nr:DUF2283 domain-containing protein [SAR202 cluster bacterium]
MEEIKVYHDRTGNTLTIWFGNPEDEYVAEETGEEIVLMKDKAGRVIGLEKLNYKVSESDDVKFSFQSIAV